MNIFTTADSFRDFLQEIPRRRLPNRKIVMVLIFPRAYGVLFSAFHITPSSPVNPRRKHQRFYFRADIVIRNCGILPSYRVSVKYLRAIASVRVINERYGDGIRIFLVREREREGGGCRSRNRRCEKTLKFIRRCCLFHPLICKR